MALAVAAHRRQNEPCHVGSSVLFADDDELFECEKIGCELRAPAAIFSLEKIVRARTARGRSQLECIFGYVVRAWCTAMPGFLLYDASYQPIRWRLTHGAEMAKKVTRSRPWTKEEVRMLKTLTGAKTKMVIARKLKRSVDAMYGLATKLGVMLGETEGGKRHGEQT